MIDYQFIITEFDGRKHYHMKRFVSELDDEEIQVAMDAIMPLYRNAKSIMLDRAFTVNK